MRKIYLSAVLFLSVPMLSLLAQNKTTNVTVDYRTQKFLGTVSKLERNKFFNMHISDSEIINDKEISSFANEYGVGAGRQFWGPFSQANAWNSAEENQAGNYPYNKLQEKDGIRPVTRIIATEHANDKILTYKHDTEKMGQWAAAYYASQDAVPEFFEPMNEPFVHAGDDCFGDAPSMEAMIGKMIDYYAACGKYIRQEPKLANMKVIGHASAWPAFEKNNFSVWETRMKRFIDVAGKYMDGISVHLYDGSNVVEEPALRSGSNSEAILDIIESYTHITLGKVLPFAISEYGGIASDENGYDDIISSRTMSTFNHIIFNLLDREDNLLISIPFACGKSQWQMTAANNFTPYGPASFIPSRPVTQVDVDNNFKNVPWKRTPKENFYKLWKGVQGERIDITSDNPDIQVNAFKDAGTLYIAMDNLDNEAHTVNLKNGYKWEGVQGSVTVRKLKISLSSPVEYSETSYPGIPESIVVRPDEAVVVVATVNSSYTNKIVRKKYYTDTYLRPIIANGNISFNFSGIESGVGRATLRMTLGRNPNASKKPVVKVNNTDVVMPVNWEGESQSTREDFFGMIEIPFDMQLLNNGDNTVSVTFPDGGGYVASMILQTEKYAVTDIINGGFENNLTNWIPLNYSGNISIDNIVKQEAKQSLKISGRSGVFQSVSTEKGVKYELNAYFKTLNDSKLYVLLKDMEGGIIAEKEFENNRRFDGLSVQFNAPGNEVMCAFMSRNENDCIWIDNVKLSVK